MAIRAAVGAGRGHLLRQALTENLLLAGLGGGLGVLVAHWAVRGLTVFGPADVPRLAQARVDGPMLAFMLAITLGAGLLFGLAPALRLSSRPPHAVLKEGRSGGVHRDRVRSALVVAEIALALILLTGAGLLIRSAAALNRVEPGYDPTGVVAGRVSLPTTGYESPDQAALRLRAPWYAPGRGAGRHRVRGRLGRPARGRQHQRAGPRRPPVRDRVRDQLVAPHRVAGLSRGDADSAAPRARSSPTRIARARRW